MHRNEARRSVNQWMFPATIDDAIKMETTNAWQP
jgi:hypothetical protein